MKASAERLIPDPGHSFRTIDRRGATDPITWHYHPEVEIIHVLEDRGRAIIGDYVGPVRRHDLLVLGSNLPHVFDSVHPGEAGAVTGRGFDRFTGTGIRREVFPALVVQFREDFVGEPFLEAAEMVGVRRMLEDACRGIRIPREQGETILERFDNLFETRGLNRLVGLIECLGETAAIADPELLASAVYRDRDGQLKESTRLHSVFEYIHANYRRNEFLARHIAEFLEMNPSALSRYFRRVTRSKPTAYITELRIAHACQLLTESDLSVMDVQRGSGFASTSYFNRAFRKHRGMSPREYRREHRRIAR